MSRPTDDARHERRTSVLREELERRLEIPNI